MKVRKVTKAGIVGNHRLNTEYVSADKKKIFLKFFLDFSFKFNILNPFKKNEFWIASN